MARYLFTAADDVRENGDRITADVVARLNRAGVVAAVLVPGKEDDGIRNLALQLLRAAKDCESEDVRAHMIEMAQSALSKLADRSTCHAEGGGIG